MITLDEVIERVRSGDRLVWVPPHIYGDIPRDPESDQWSDDCRHLMIGRLRLNTELELAVVRAVKEGRLVEVEDQEVENFTNIYLSSEEE